MGVVVCGFRRVLVLALVMHAYAFVVVGVC